MTAHATTASDIFAARLDAAIMRVRDMAHLHSTGPFMANALREVADELACLRRDLSGLGGATLTAAPAWESRQAKEGDRRTLGRRQNSPVDHAGQRHCPTHDEGDGAWLPIESFGWKDKAKGYRQSRCRECILAYQRARYVRVGYKVVTVEVVEGDACIGHKCPVCHEPFEAGQRVQGGNVRHEECA